MEDRSLSDHLKASVAKVAAAILIPLFLIVGVAMMIYQRGVDSGREQGEQAGIARGREEGIQEGEIRGKETGEKTGYQQGYEDRQLGQPNKLEAAE